MSDKCPAVPTQVHTWVFEYDDPYYVCHYCGEKRGYTDPVPEEPQP